MASVPDIIVTFPDSPRVQIAIVALLNDKTVEGAAQQLRRYMIKMSCPVGLLISPEKLHIYRNPYTGSDEKTIDEVGNFQLGDDFRSFAQEAGGYVKNQEEFFENYVQDWLEHLPNSSEIERLPANFKSALERYVIPALETGVVRAAGPREMRGFS